MRMLQLLLILLAPATAGGEPHETPYPCSSAGGTAQLSPSTLSTLTSRARKRSKTCNMASDADAASEGAPRSSSASPVLDGGSKSNDPVVISPAVGRDGDLVIRTSSSSGPSSAPSTSPSQRPKNLNLGSAIGSLLAAFIAQPR